MAQAQSGRTQAPSDRTHDSRLVEQAHSRYKVYVDGNSRSMTIPAEVEIRKDQMLRMRRGMCGEQTVYLKAIPDSVSPTRANPESTVAGVREKQVRNHGQSRWKVRECHKGQTIFTIPSCFGWDCFGKDSSQVVVSGWVDGEIRYLMAIPVRFWAGPEGVAGGLELPR